MIRSLAVLSLLVGLAACGEKPAEAPANDRRGAEGEVLGGTISDAMLPLATVRSESPPMEPAPASPSAGEEPAESGGEAPAPSPEPAAEPQPETEPAPEESDG